MAQIPALDGIRIIPRESDFLDRKSGSRGEIFYDKSANTLRLYDGSVAGGIKLARTDLINISNSDFAAKAVAAGVGGSEGGPAFRYVKVTGQNTITADEVGNDLNIVAGTGILLTTDASTDTLTITATGVSEIIAGSGITVDVAGGSVTINSVADTGNITFDDHIITSVDSAAVVFGTRVDFASDIVVGNEIQFADGSIQRSAAGPVPGPQGETGPQGPSGPSGSGSGDVNSLATSTDNAIVRYHEATGTIIQNSSAILGDDGVITATGFVGNLSANNLSSGTIPTDRFPDPLPALSGTNLTNLNATNLSSGTVPNARFPAVLPAVSGTNLTNLNAAALTSGVVPIARLASAGTPSDTTYLRGDGTWADVTEAGSSNSFNTITVSGQNDVVADSATDTLTLAAGNGITITTDSTTDTITITNSANTNFSTLTDASAAGMTVDKFYLPAITELRVYNSGATAYLFDQYPGPNPTIYAISGTTIAFNLDAVGHPFLIQDGTGNNYDAGLIHVSTSGVVSTEENAQGKSSGTLYWKIPSTISGGYRYQCQNHIAMVGSIQVKNIISI